MLALRGDAPHLLLVLNQCFEGVTFLLQHLDSFQRLIQLFLQTDELVLRRECLLFPRLAALPLALELLFGSFLGCSTGLELFLQLDKGTLCLERLFSGASNLLLP
jgi:hypothetical protein